MVRAVKPVSGDAVTGERVWMSSVEGRVFGAVPLQISYCTYGNGIFDQFKHGLFGFRP